MYMEGSKRQFRNLLEKYLDVRGSWQLRLGHLEIGRSDSTRLSRDSEREEGGVAAAAGWGVRRNAIPACCEKETWTGVTGLLHLQCKECRIAEPHASSTSNANKAD
ncbi:hypothetical protein E4U17_002877 [Claviceps sp. LM77 group G4]|nr:hypothetical protein E4U17_002877 [Claviceps sp. LM77 group G4]